MDQVSADILQMALVLKFGGGIESNFMVNPPNLLKVLLFTFNIIIIRSILVLFKLFENWNKSKFGGGIEEVMVKLYGNSTKSSQICAFYH